MSHVAWTRHTALGGLLCQAALGCSADPGPVFDRAPLDPALASLALVDRFGAAAGTLHVRGTDSLPLPAAGDPVDFDDLFLLRGLGPDGQRVRYYDLDIHSQLPAKLYTFSKDGEALLQQLPVLATVPGEPGYNDFVRVFDVQVPPGYQENSIRSEADLLDSHFLVNPTDHVINRPVVPDGSSAQQRIRGGDPGLVYAWHAGELAPAFVFESEVVSQSIGFDERSVDISTIYETFNVNPGQQGGGPASGLRMEANSQQTHNVVDAIPGDPLYSPLWMVIMYDNAAFDRVLDDESAEAAPVVAGVTSPLLDAPIVEVEGAE